MGTWKGQKGQDKRRGREQGGMGGMLPHPFNIWRMEHCVYYHNYNSLLSSLLQTIIVFVVKQNRYSDIRNIPGWIQGNDGGASCTEASVSVGD